MDDNGSFTVARVRVKVETRRLPSTTWDDHGEYELSSSSTKPARGTYELDMGTPGQFEVRCKKVTGTVSTSRASNEVELVALKSYQQASTACDAFAQVGLRIKASGQLTVYLENATLRDAFLNETETSVVVVLKV